MKRLYNNDDLLHGLKEYIEETDDHVVQIFYNIWNVNLDIHQCIYIEGLKRIGWNGDQKPLEIKLLSKKMVTYILQNRHYFRSSKFTVSEYLDKK